MSISESWKRMQELRNAPVSAEDDAHAHALVELKRTGFVPALLLSPGDIFASYEVQAPLGDGTFSRVYHAEDLMAGRTVALKVLRAAKAVDPAMLRSFTRESGLLKTLTHPGIPRCFEAGEADGAHYLTLELASGETLERRIDAGRLPGYVHELLQIVEPLFAAVSYLHTQGVVHRDLKPANVLVDSSSKGVGVKVIDFNVAWKMGGSFTGDIGHGTQAYMSPEQALKQVPDPRDDVYSLACIVYELMTGQNPALLCGIEPLVSSEFFNRLQRRTLRIASPLAVWTTSGRYSPVLAGVVMKGLAAHREDRYDSVQHFIEALRAAAAMPTPHALKRAIAFSKARIEYELLRRRVRRELEYQK